MKNTLLFLLVATLALPAADSTDSKPGKSAKAGRAALVPDIDGIYYFADRQRYIEYHRTYTHTVLFLPVLRWYRPREYIQGEAGPPDQGQDRAATA